MAIAAGKHLGPYRILSLIGAGGRGEVYRARDTRLDRIVAVKALPAHLADKAELRERFEREAGAIAGSNQNRELPRAAYNEIARVKRTFSIPDVVGSQGNSAGKSPANPGRAS